MSEEDKQNAIVSRSATQSDPIPVDYSPEEIQFFLQTLDFYRTAVHHLTNTIPPTELVIVLAFLQAAMETQAPVFTEAFEDVRNFFGKVYPNILAGELERRREAGEEVEEGIRIVIPAPAPGLRAVEPGTEEPRIIMPGTRRVQ